MADSYNDYKKASERRRLRVERDKLVPKSELESIYGIPDRGPNRGLSQAKVKVDSSDAVADKKKSSVQGSPPAPKSGTQNTGVASDKSRVAGKMTAFQRMKARQYEKEGVGGRPMTRAAAQKKAMSEKSGSLKMPSLGRLFAKQGKVTFAQPQKGATRSQVAAFRSKMQGRNK